MSSVCNFILCHFRQLLVVLTIAISSNVFAEYTPLPSSLEIYGDADWKNPLDIINHRIATDPFLLWATLIFLGAILHTFFAAFFHHVAQKWEKIHPQRKWRIKILHLLGEIELVFLIWTIPLLLLISIYFNFRSAYEYVFSRNYTEAFFVVVVMIISSSQPILNLAERVLFRVAKLGSGSPATWWLAVLTICPILGSFITEPAAMTLSAMLLSRYFYKFKVSSKLAYATLGLLFVNISVGGALTSFSAPAILMVAAPWDWDTLYMLQNFGLKAISGIICNNLIYYFVFRRELQALTNAEPNFVENRDAKSNSSPFWIILIHILFLGSVVYYLHYPIAFLSIFAAYALFHKFSKKYQSDMNYRSAILVGLFFIGLVIHGGFQGWWIDAVLKNLEKSSLTLVVLGLSAFNDNAAITYLSTFIPNFPEVLKQTVVAGAVIGGGLTIIANAPNPAGKIILEKHFSNEISHVKLFLGALTPTIILLIIFQVL